MKRATLKTVYTSREENQIVLLYSAVQLQREVITNNSIKQQ